MRCGVLFRRVRTWYLKQRSSFARELWRIEVLVEFFVIPVTWSREESWGDIDSDILRK